MKSNLISTILLFKSKSIFEVRISPAFRLLCERHQFAIAHFDEFFNMFYALHTFSF